MINKYVLITGGTQGIGLELAKIFAKNGHNLIIVARHENELAKAKINLEAFGVEVITIAKDLFNPHAAFELYRQTTDRNLLVNILVNNAGQGLYGLFENTDIDRELAIVQLNISSTIVLTKLYLQDMLVQGDGRVLNLSSIASKAPGPWQSVYHGTKAFVQSFTEALRSEVKEKGIVVTALLPGATDTDFFNKANMTESKAVQDKSKLADPADVAEAGYNALMNDEDMVVAGFKNKMNVAMSNIMPDSIAADNMKNSQKPAEQ
ncbi:SDR family NAD(P)-dependent oxidoreductase [Niabella ginsengisoli]|uniref:SDR family oxidoreductase n=1 Tax=Niabella ginsengisoli TaxID=522298 RepID=A0ABS9SKF4_9BACT|nr:SDR family oxidoreductase [Niabella ginsengisoli]MCH5598859.1 SDR family oxidoreductase [Niabella ginsengisoli]